LTVIGLPFPVISPADAALAPAPTIATAQTADAISLALADFLTRHS
jgi:hypothetical protein